MDKVIFRKADTEGNILTVFDNGVIHLYLVSEGYPREIGWIEDRTYKKHIKEEHIYRALNAVGLNSMVMEELHVDTIVVGIDGVERWISYEKFLEHRVFLHHKDQGFELQCFVPLECFNILEEQ